jgi:hypothetical protein
MAQVMRTIETRLATMSLVEPGLIVQRFRDGAKLDRPGFEENRKARAELSAGKRHAMLSVFPKDIDFELEITTRDHFQPERDKNTMTALAVVAHDTLATSLSKLFFSYYPQVFDTELFATEDEALTWLRGKLSGQ